MQLFSRASDVAGKGKLSASLNVIQEPVASYRSCSGCTSAAQMWTHAPPRGFRGAFASLGCPDQSCKLRQATWAAAAVVAVSSALTPQTPARELPALDSS